MKHLADDFNVILTKIVVAHKHLYDTTGSFDCKNGRNAYGIVHLITGELDYRFYNGKRIKAYAGDTILFKPTDGYKVTCPLECQHYTINFHLLPSSIEGTLAKKIFLEKETAIIQKDTALSHIDTLEQVCQLWQQKEAGYQMKAIQLTYKLLYNFIKKQTSVYQNDDYHKLKPAIDLLENSWNSDISLSTLANACILSVPYFRHLFYRVFATSPIQYRDTLRILHAKDYLLLENLSISDVARKCGFEDVNYFCRFFKKHTGITPSQYASSR